MLTAEVNQGLATDRESIINDAPRLFESFEVGDVSHQGDVIFVRIAKLPQQITQRANRQLADGNTQGSRHILTPRAKLYDAVPAELSQMIREATGANVEQQYIGPVFVSPDEPTAHDVTHPEHGHQGFPAGAVIACVFQRSLDAEERARRVMD